MKRFFALTGLAAMVLLVPVRGMAQDDQYLHIYSLIQDGDNLKSSGQSPQALTKYLEAQSALRKFQKIYPTWNTTVVNYRLNYLASKIGDTSAKAPLNALDYPPAAKTNAPAASTGAPAQPAANTELENQLRSVQVQLRQLQTDKTVLEAQLKEALAAQPAAVDPRELSKAQDQIKSLQKENDLLKVNLAKPQAKGGPTVDPKAFEQLQQQLAEANRRLAEQAETANVLSLEKSALQNKLNSMIAAPWNETNVSLTRKALDDANRQFNEQKALVARQEQEMETMRGQIKQLTTEAQTASALRAENEVLKKQLAALQVPGQMQESSRQLAEARAQVAALQSDKDVLTLEKTALQDQLKKLSGRPPQVAASVSNPDAAASARVKQLEQERDDLQKKLEAAQKELYGRNSQAAASHVEELTGQLEILRTRLGVFEAQKVPFTSEELALFRRPEAAPIDPNAGKKPVTELPPGSVNLVAEAQRDFAARRFEQAEEKYRQLLRQDEKNVYTLANLAAIQLEMNHLDDAEKNIQKALAVAPDDAYSLSIMGFLKFRQQKFDEALDVLGRAAKLDPQNAEIQNYLGLALSQKGMRASAETALRKAIEIDPNYASAHYNLAVIYVTARPRAVEMARLHYKKALAAGLSPNPEMEKLLEDSKAPDGSH